jgi:hypothetical protein
MFWPKPKIVGSKRSQKYSKILTSFFPPSYLTCSQIWLIPLVDDCPGDYITKLEGKKEKKPACKSSIKTEFWCLNSDGWVKL